MRVEPLRSPLDIERMEHALRWYGYRNWMFFKLGINTALRGGDLIRLQARHVRASHLMLKESKTRKLNRFYLNDSMRPFLDDYVKYMDDDDYLFRSRYQNVPMTIGSAYRMMAVAAERIGLKNIGTHTCRKTFGYHFYRQTQDIAMLMELLNHSSERETLYYIGVLQDDADSAVKGFFL
ncbi:Phage integrase family protein [Paenibacillus algorifonticola]|uniref:Phage integrase family protein n=3 Tax=Paenibacillus algorifonticola TaxID=684063 RepID=A0A1I2J3Z3_9BACL|nr:tyrosine-type recombinase/integrase [Paenibacillus algorifonticola]SFF49462.1 Phage integrase family protein [Paenibacillus algorifonticola]